MGEGEQMMSEQEHAAKRARLFSLGERGLSTKNLMRRFAARTPEQHVDIVKSVFWQTFPSDEAAVEFYTRWNQVERVCVLNTKEAFKYLERVEALDSALKRFE
jgi:hypothetical protein